MISTAALEAESGMYVYVEEIQYSWSVFLLNLLLWTFVSGLVALVLLLIFN